MELELLKWTLDIGQMGTAANDYHPFIFRFVPRSFILWWLTKCHHTIMKIHLQKELSQLSNICIANSPQLQANFKVTWVLIEFLHFGFSELNIHNCSLPACFPVSIYINWSPFLYCIFICAHDWRINWKVMCVPVLPSFKSFQMDFPTPASLQRPLQIFIYQLFQLPH